MKLGQTTSRALYLFAAAGLALVAAQVLLIWQTIGLTHRSAAAFTAVLPLVLGLAVPTACLLALAPRLAVVEPSRAALAVLVATGLAIRLVWFAVPAPLEDDYQRYLWDGGVAAHGLDPYRFSPDQFTGRAKVAAITAPPPAYRQLASRAGDALGQINFPDQRSIYPSVAQAAFALGHILAPFKINGLRAVFLVSELATCALLIGLLMRMGHSPLWAALYWWNPFVATMLIGIAHIDALVPPFVLGALALIDRGRAMAALACLGLAAGVKIWPLVLAPMVLWPLLRSRPRAAFVGAALLAAVLAISIGPVLLSAIRPGSGLAAYAQGWSSNNAIFAWSAHGLGVLTGSAETGQALLRLGGAIATATIALGAAAAGDRSLASVATRMMVVAAAVFYLSPAQFPWYAVWFLPLAAMLRCWPLLLASATLPAYYLFFPFWETDRGNVFVYGVALIHALPVLGWLLVDWGTRRRRTTQGDA